MSTNNNAPLVIAEQGGFWVGAAALPSPQGTAPKAAMYVQYQIPAERRHRWPLVLVHGGGGQGTDFLHTPDGRPGWATWFLREGWAVYVVDRPGHGRSPFHPATLAPMGPPASYEMMQMLCTAPSPQSPWPTAALANQWPGSGCIGDAVMDQFMASQGPLIPNLAATQALMAPLGVELLERIGPAVLLTHSMGGPFGWLTADARPDLVKAIVAVEPLCPPFSEPVPGMGPLAWGLTAVPMQFDPPAAAAADLQGAARRLPQLEKVPTVVVTGEASFMAPMEQAMVDFLVQAGVAAQHLRLEEHGLHGNGHMMMLEKNSDAIAALIDAWLRRTVPAV
jgi:pimeloyl-ACP methyl ester carboxylesterase